MINIIIHNKILVLFLKFLAVNMYFVNGYYTIEFKKKKLRSLWINV